jgi:hypothetical protein
MYCKSATFDITVSWQFMFFMKTYVTTLIRVLYVDFVVVNHYRYLKTFSLSMCTYLSRSSQQYSLYVWVGNIGRVCSVSTCQTMWCAMPTAIATLSHDMTELQFDASELINGVISHNGLVKDTYHELSTAFGNCYQFWPMLTRSTCTSHVHPIARRKGLVSYPPTSP